MTYNLDVKIKKIRPDALTPTYATDGSGAFDLYYMGSSIKVVNYSFPLKLDTGLAFEIPQGHVMLIFSRSGHGFNQGIRLSNAVGVIDSDYTGEVKVKLICDEPGSQLVIKPGDRIAQAIVLPYPKVTFTEVAELSETERGAGGFGSTGT